jgi:hypothetical protein
MMPSVDCFDIVLYTIVNTVEVDVESTDGICVLCVCMSTKGFVSTMKPIGH